MRHVLSKRPGDKGFSLIELVIVVAVLAILAAIAVPAFNNVAENGRQAAAQTALLESIKNARSRGYPQEPQLTHNSVPQAG